MLFCRCFIDITYSTVWSWLIFTQQEWHTNYHRILNIETNSNSSESRSKITPIGSHISLHTKLHKDNFVCGDLKVICNTLQQSQLKYKFSSWKHMPITTYFDDIHKASRPCFFNFLHICTEANSIADVLAKQAIKSSKYM